MLRIGPWCHTSTMPTPPRSWWNCRDCTHGGAPPPGVLKGTVQQLVRFCPRFANKLNCLMSIPPLFISILVALFSALVVLLRHWPGSWGLAFHSFLSHPLWSVILVHLLFYCLEGLLLSSWFRHFRASRVDVRTIVPLRPPIVNLPVVQPASTPLSADVTNRSPRLPFSHRDV